MHVYVQMYKCEELSADRPCGEGQTGGVREPGREGQGCGEGYGEGEDEEGQGVRRQQAHHPGACVEGVGHRGEEEGHRKARQGRQYFEGLLGE